MTLDALDSGFYFANGTHSPAIENLPGQFTSEHRSFFVFDRASVSGTAQSATLRLFNREVSQFLHGYVLPDLGSGTLYGSRSVSASDNGTVVEIILNSSAVAALNSGTGLFLIGGALGSISGPADQYAFGFSMASFVPDHTRQLVLDVTAVPEPSTAGFVSIGVLMLAAARLRKRAQNLT